jgi:ABC-type sugar transport system substrate-binding protein
MKIRNIVIACLLGIAVLGTTGVARAGDVRMFVRHEVADYGAWRKTYDAFAPTQKKLGVIFHAVYQSTDDPNDVTVIHDFHSLEKAKAFAASAELKAAMEKAGVKGAPQIWYTTKSTK